MEAVVSERLSRPRQRYLITGGAGFIGSHLAELLVRHGHSVTAVDNLVTGQVENLQSLKLNPNFDFVEDSVLNEKLMGMLVPRHDVVIHLAAAVGVKWIIENPLLSIHTNIRATEIVLDAASHSGTKVLVASTSEVYGKNPKPVLSEEDDSVIGATHITRWLYANTKATDEFLALAYHRDKDLPVIITRFFNTVGPRQTGRYGMVVPRFVRQALAGEPITVFGDGSQTRCFTDVRDSIRAVAELCEMPEAVGQVFNIGNPREISFTGLAETIRRMTDSHSELHYIPYEEAFPVGFEDMERRVPSTVKLERYLGWAPGISLEANLARIIEFERHGVLAGVD